MSHKGALSKLNRYITAHHPTGKSVFTTSVPESVVQYGAAVEDPTQIGSSISPTATSSCSIAYTTQDSPVSLAQGVDIDAYKAHLSQTAYLPLPFVFPNGTTTHYSEIGPGLMIPMHQTVTIDQIVVLDGELELLLDSGQSRLLRRGDMVVQRGTRHAWRNPSKTEWVRLFAVVQPIDPVVVNGKELQLEFDGISKL